jgi:hypothetical protein
MTIREAKHIIEKSGYRALRESKGVTITVYHEVEGEELEFEVTGSVSEYHPATMYDRNGDPGSPEEGGEFEVDEITPDPEDYGIDPEIISAKAEEKLWDDEDYYLGEDDSYEDDDSWDDVDDAYDRFKDSFE